MHFFIFHLIYRKRKVPKQKRLLKKETIEVINNPFVIKLEPFGKVARRNIRKGLPFFFLLRILIGARRIEQDELQINTERVFLCRNISYVIKVIESGEEKSWVEIKMCKLGMSPTYL